MYYTNQSHFNYLCDDLKHGVIDRQTYVKRINESFNEVDPKYRPGLQRRADNRPFGRFALDVYDSTVRERFLVDEWRKIYNDNLKVHDYAHGNDGRLILDQNSMEGRADYWIESPQHDGRFKLEVKFCPCLWKLTFKICDLREYARADAYVLVILGNSKMIGPNGDPNSTKPLEIPPGLRWCLFGRKAIREMLSKIPHKLHREVGGKPSIQLRNADINRFLKIREWK